MITIYYNIHRYQYAYTAIKANERKFFSRAVLVRMNSLHPNGAFTLKPRVEPRRVGGNPGDPPVIVRATGQIGRATRPLMGEEAPRTL